MAPDEVVTLLNDTFSLFDRLVQKHEIEKIKTIGDAYMAVSGVPIRHADHAARVAETALDMLAEVARSNAERDRQVHLRIGLNTGPVVAGIIDSPCDQQRRKIVDPDHD
jgi:class 3 adenylate cyclase